MPQVGEIFSCGVDWVTATYKPDSAAAEVLRKKCHEHWAAVEQAGGEVKPTGPKSYSSYSGGGVTFGVRHDSLIFQATGAAANVWYTEVLKYGGDPNITRLDLEVTSYRRPGDFNFAPRYRNAIRRHERRLGRARPTVLDVVDKNLSGDSVAIAPRSSEFHCRIYDKSDESEGLVPPDLTRFESENKEALARRLWQELATGASPQHLARNHNLERLQRLGLQPEWANHAVPEKYTPSREKTDDYRRIMYLADHVSLMVEGLVERGFEYEVISALKLHDVVQRIQLNLPPPLPERTPRQEAAARAKQRVRESLNLAPPNAHKAETVPQGDCICMYCAARRYEIEGDGRHNR